MDQQPERQGMEGPKRSGPSSRGPVSEPVSGRGGAYTAPPPAEGAAGPGGRTRSGRWWIAPLLAAALLGGAYIYHVSSGPAPVAEQTMTAALPVLMLAAADIDQPATELARRLIAEESVPLPDETAVVTAPAIPGTSRPAAAPPTTAAAVVPAAIAPTLAPVVHRPKAAAGAPKQVAPALAPAAETEKAVLQVLAKAPAKTRSDIAAGRTVIYSLHVLDDVVEDGDVVDLIVNGVSHGRILLSSAGQDVLIPLPAGSTASVKALAVEDGGGGVTFGVTTSQGEIRSTVMAIGQSDDWSVSIQ